ncbi:uncharacterized protein G2W53_004131 [Senna tora]|uniref:Uncharacterized protein n=1 Tax=Senna tora TaxID=362788 RepID=A0A834XCD9_9FABA|nr:uncharacterized protein G2W53_004131 [Senna tora]
MRVKFEFKDRVPKSKIELIELENFLVLRAAPTFDGHLIKLDQEEG